MAKNQIGKQSDKLFLFDVDGTLTPSRAPMDPEFAAEFKSFADRNITCLVTGSDYAKTVEQVPESVLNAVVQVYSCSGNEVYRQGRCTYSDTGWQPSRKLKEWLNTQLEKSKFPLDARTGNHFEQRSGCMNYSIVGRGCTQEQRIQYREYDQHTQERARIAQECEQLFPNVSARLGGETGIDIGPAGSDKSQILTRLPHIVGLSDPGSGHVWQLDDIVFFGDATYPGGNDHSLAQWIERTHAVQDWQETRQILRELYK